MNELPISAHLVMRRSLAPRPPAGAWVRLSAVLASAILFLTAARAPAAYVTNIFIDLQANRYSPSPIRFFPLSTPLALTDGTTNYTVMDIPRQVWLTNGVMSPTWLVGGLYKVSFPNPNKDITILVPPDDTNIYSFNTVANLATNVGTFSWTNYWTVVGATNILGIWADPNGQVSPANSNAGAIYYQAPTNLPYNVWLWGGTNWVQFSAP